MSGETIDVLARALAHATAYLEGLETAPVGATATVEDLRARLGGELPRQGTPALEVIDQLVAGTAGGHLGSAGGRFFAWVIGGSLSSSLAADWLASTWDQNAALYACGPAAAIVEEVAGNWLKALLGLPAGASFAFTTGCQLAHFTCLAAARHAVLREAGWDVNADGLFGAPAITAVVSAARHASVDRALRFLGLGDRSMAIVPTDGDGQIDPGQLESTLSSLDGPAVVVLNAADLDIAAFDRFDLLIPLAREAGAWVHVDGAFGLMARASRDKRARLAGVELADSWATDGHKWLNVPFDSGFACVRDVDAHRASMAIAAPYIAADRNARDPIDWNPEWSRRARGFAIYCALRELGSEGVERLVDRSCSLARRLVDGLGALPGAEVVRAPTLNQGLVRFRDDRRTDEVIAAVNATGEAFFSPTTWRGARAMRVSVVSWRTTERDVDRAIAAVAGVLAS